MNIVITSILMFIAIIGIIPFIIILLGTSLIIPYILYCKKTLKHIKENQDNKTIQRAGIISLILPPVICLVSAISTGSSDPSWYSNLGDLERTLILGPILSIIEITCIYLCFHVKRYNRTVISDINNTKNFISSNKYLFGAAIIILLIFGLVKYSFNNYYSIVSDKLPIKYDTYHVNIVEGGLIEFKNNNTIIYTSGTEYEQSETSTYKYIYNKKDKEIKFYNNKNYVYSKLIVYSDDDMIIVKSKNKSDEITIWSKNKLKDNFLDNYKKESNIDVSGYYQYDENTEVYLSKDNKIYFGTKDGIKKGTYEVLEFKVKELSYPVINYTLEGKTKIGNTHGSRYYNDTAMYIKDKNTKSIMKCAKESISCKPAEREVVLKKINNITELKYLKNIT